MAWFNSSGQIKGLSKPNGADLGAFAFLDGRRGEGLCQKVFPKRLVSSMGGGRGIGLLLIHMTAIAGIGFLHKGFPCQQSKIGSRHTVGEQHLGPAVRDDMVGF